MHSSIAFTPKQNLTSKIENKICINLIMKLMPGFSSQSAKQEQKFHRLKKKELGITWEAKLSERVSLFVENVTAMIGDTDIAYRNE